MEIDMSYKIVVDSCCELPKELLQDVRFERVPLELSVGDYHIQDEKILNRMSFWKRWRHIRSARIFLSIPP